METQQYIESGILELYVFGVLNESEMSDVAEMAKNNEEIRIEIASIEKAIMTLNYSMSPKLSADNFARIRSKIFEEKQKIIQLETDDEPTQSNFKSYLGWAAALIFAAGIGYQYINNQDLIKQNKVQVAAIEKEKVKLKNDFDVLRSKNNKNFELAQIVKTDICNRAVELAGQTVAPTAKAKIYWNKYSKEVYVDATDLPTPPEGKEYQIWSLKMNPLTPTSIGLLSDFKDNSSKFFAVNSTENAEGFGITLENIGGSLSPTMDQLYTLGKI